ncbi:hypothetical protein [Micromonospora costi]|uniref:Uncharacterized protein n=1 Tax=Micromonospora costi TaxID=1530042 RepID=A0A3A9ZPS5_9ACTN|nr:hypothetical protein [Micromonospora costi]RKN50173.1 hypothetical protein D7193_30435 [Micromonospora costi]
MAAHVLRSIAAFGFGLFVAFVGLVWVANLFGVAEEHRRQIARSQWTQGWYDSEQEALANTGQIGRYLAGGMFLLAGVALAVAAVVYLVQGPDG